MEFLSDLRLAGRRLASNPAFALTAIATLAIGTGANSTVFSLANRILLRPLPVERPAELVSLNMKQGSGFVPAFSYPNYRDLRDRNRTLASLITYRFAPVALSRGGANERLWGFAVSGNYFESLGVRAQRGRMIGPSDDVLRGGHPVLVISHACWQRTFGADPDIAGKPAVINGRSFTILGVAPPTFRGTELFYAADIYIPMAMIGQVEPGAGWLEERDAKILFVVGRRKPGISVRAAQADLAAVASQLAAEHPRQNGGFEIRLSPPGLAGSFLRGPILGFIGVLLGVTILVLLIACTNLAAFLLARMSDRRREIGISLALGASRGRLVRQMLTESLLISVLGGIGGLILANWLTGLLAVWKPPVDLPLDLSSGIDGNVAAFTAAIAIATTFLFGLLPALQAARTDLLACIKDAMPGGARWSGRDVLVAGQVALSVVLLAGSMLVLRSLSNALTVNLGFEPRGAALANFDLALHGYDVPRGLVFQRQLFDKLQSSAEFESASIGDRLPLGLDFSKGSVRIEGRPEPKATEAPEVFRYYVFPGYLETLKTRLLAGRGIERTDQQGRLRVAVVNEAFARKLLPGESAIGKRLRYGATGEWREIVGVVETGKYFSLSEQGEPAVFESMQQNYSPQVAVIARSGAGGERALAAVRKAVLDLDAGITFAESGTILDHLRLPLFPARLAAGALASFGAIAVLLAAVGIYGLMSYSVARRTREFGIRSALGASTGHVLRSALARTGTLLGVGLAVGLAGSAALGGLFGAILYNVNPRDPLALSLAAALILAIGAGACIQPARRALRVNPSQALREQ